MLFTYKSDSAIRQLHSSAWHSSSNTSEVDKPHVMRENSKDLAYGLIGTLKYEGILHLIKEGFRDRGSKQGNEATGREGLVW